MYFLFAHHFKSVRKHRFGSGLVQVTLPGEPTRLGIIWSIIKDILILFRSHFSFLQFQQMSLFLFHSHCNAHLVVYCYRTIVGVVLVKNKVLRISLQHLIKHYITNSLPL